MTRIESMAENDKSAEPRNRTVEVARKNLELPNLSVVVMPGALWMDWVCTSHRKCSDHVGNPFSRSLVMIEGGLRDGNMMLV